MESRSIKNTDIAIINDTVDVKEQKHHSVHWSKRIHPRNKKDVSNKVPGEVVPISFSFCAFSGIYAHFWGVYVDKLELIL